MKFLIIDRKEHRTLILSALTNKESQAIELQISPRYEISAPSSTHWLRNGHNTGRGVRRRGADLRAGFSGHG